MGDSFDIAKNSNVFNFDAWLKQKLFPEKRLFIHNRLVQCVAEGSGNVIFISRYVICMNLDRNVALMSYAIKTTS